MSRNLLKVLDSNVNQINNECEWQFFHKKRVTDTKIFCPFRMLEMRGSQWRLQVYQRQLGNTLSWILSQFGSASTSTSQKWQFRTAYDQERNLARVSANDVNDVAWTDTKFHQVLRHSKFATHRTSTHDLFHDIFAQLERVFPSDTQYFLTHGSMRMVRIFHAWTFPNFSFWIEHHHFDDFATRLAYERRHPKGYCRFYS